MHRIILITLLSTGCAASTTSEQNNDPNDATSSNNTNSTSSATNNGADGGAVEFTTEVWADNWFAMYEGETLVGEDSVPITTERSFNAEVFSFEATYPLHLNVIVKDFKENDSGLEYIGQPNQQMGDGGLIIQVRERSSGALVAVTDATWKCMPIHRAPLNKDCEDSTDPLAECVSEILEEPAGWKAAGFDASAWPAAVVHSAQAVGPKDGYDEITWDPTASLIWGSDLETDNTLLCTVTVPSP